MKKLVAVAVLFFVGIIGVSGVQSYTYTLPAIFNQISIGKTLVVELNSSYLTLNEEWKTEEKYFLNVEKINFSYPPIGTHPRVVILGTAYDRHQKNVGSFKTTIDILGSGFAQFSITLSKNDGAYFAYDGNLLIGIDKKVKGGFIFEMRMQKTDDIPTEIGYGEVSISIPE